MKETLKTMKEMLISQTQPQIANLQCADYRELGEAIDMIKDLEEALYYCAVVEAMEKPEEEKYMRQMPTENNNYYYTERYMPMYDDWSYRDIDKYNGKMYYGNGDSSSSGNTSTSNMSSGQSMNYSEYPMMKDSREGRSPMSRRHYMESKSQHQDKSKQLKELETYMQELTNDITEMINGSSPEEKQLLQKKLTTLSQKIEQMN